MCVRDLDDIAMHPQKCTFVIFDVILGENGDKRDFNKKKILRVLTPGKTLRFFNDTVIS